MFKSPSQWIVLLATSCFSLAAAISIATQPASALRSGTWTWPVQGTHTVISDYQAPLNPYSAGHRGIDIVAKPGDPVYAPDDGVIHFAGTVVDRGVLSIDHGKFHSSFEPIDTDVHQGQIVHRGQQIGIVASSNHCTCLHLGARQDDNYLSPLALLSAIEPAVLMAWED